MKVELIKYNLNISLPNDADKYNLIRGKCKKLGYVLFDVYSNAPFNHYDMPSIQTIDPSHLFANQYNTIEGYRIHDWYESIVENRNIKQGYYLDGDIETLNEAKRTQLVCGYCGDRSYDHSIEFCDKCLDSEYLERKNLYLLRLLPVCDEKNTRKPLSNSEKDVLYPLFTHRQTIATDSRNVAKLAKQRMSIVKKYQRINRTNLTEYRGFTWFMDNHLPIDNIIYYDHSNHFCIGWRQPVDDEVSSKFLELMSEFPYPYKIKRQSGHTLEGGYSVEVSD